MNIGFIQFQPFLGKVEKTIQILDNLIDSASSANLIVLPELCNSGYNFKDYQMAWNSSEVILKSKFVEFLISKALKHNMFIVSGINERDNDELFNSAVIVGPKGYIGKYRKLHLFLNEKDIFKPGNNGLPVFDIEVAKIGILICFDWMFPEIWRILAVKGADVICHTSNLVLPGLAQRAIPIHSLINRIFIVTSNRTGQEGDLTFTGNSIISDPMGQVICKASETNEEIGIAEIDISMARNKYITPKNNIFEDMRPSEYHRCLSSN